MDSVHHIWCPLSSQEYQDLPDGAETTLTDLTTKRVDDDSREPEMKKARRSEPKTQKAPALPRL